MFSERKNSITLAALWLAILILGIAWYTRTSGKLVGAKLEQAKYEAQISNLGQETTRLVEVRALHADLSEKLIDAPKKIIAADEPSFSLSYMNWIISENNLKIEFDFVLNEKKDLGEYTAFTYTLTGEGAYSDIYKLIWHLTYEPYIYKIQSLKITSNELNSRNLKFKMQLRGFTVNDQSLLEKEYSAFQKVNKNGIYEAADIFKPIIKRKPKARPVRKRKPTLPPKLPGQIDVEKATLKVVMTHSIFISDRDNGLVQLKVGDRVYLGKLVRINQKTNQAEFVIKKFGKSQRIRLAINQRK